MTASDQNRVLAALRRDLCQTAVEIALKTDFRRDYVTVRLRKLIARGLATRAEIGCYKLTEAGEAFLASGQKIGRGRLSHDPAPTRVNSSAFQRRIWQALRLNVHTYGDIGVFALSDNDTMRTLQSYIRTLMRAGYVIELASERTEGQRGHGYKRFRLRRDTGPEAPWRLVKKGVLYDPNTQQEVPLVRRPSKEASHEQR